MAAKAGAAVKDAADAGVPAVALLAAGGAIEREAGTEAASASPRPSSRR